jgi:hypothetical protein
MGSCGKCDRERRARSGKLDVLGLGFSGLCIVHCLALPVLIAALPLWPGLVAWHAGLHVVFLGLIVPTTLVAMWFGYRRHGSIGPMSILAAGLLVIILAEVVGHGLGFESSESAMSIAGSTLLVAGHWRNYTSSRRHISTCSSRT